MGWITCGVMARTTCVPTCNMPESMAKPIGSSDTSGVSRTARPYDKPEFSPRVSGCRCKVSTDNPLSQTDPLGHKLTYVYDNQDRLIQTIDALGHATVFEYDVVGD